MRKNLHVYNGAEALAEDFRYWSNSQGDLFDRNGADIQSAELPAELERACSILWNNLGWSWCYLAEFKDTYGVALEASYLDAETARPDAEKAAREFPKLDVILGIKTTQWDGLRTESNVLLFVPWDTPRDEFNSIQRKFDQIAGV